MTSDQYSELVAFIAQKFDEQWRHTVVLMEQAREERRILGEGVDARLMRVDARLDGIDLRLDKMDNRFDKMDNRFDKMDNRFDKMDQRFDELNEDFGGRLRSLEEWVRRVGTDHQRRLRALEHPRG